MRIHRYSFAYIFALIFICSASYGADKLLTLDDLQGKVKAPSWAKPRMCAFDEKKPWKLFGAGRKSASSMKSGTARLNYVAGKYKSSKKYPFLHLRYAEHLVDLNQDALAYQELKEVLALPDNTPHDSKIYMLPNLSAVKKRARLGLMRVLARNKLTDETLKVMENIQFQSSYDKLLKAEALALLGKHDESKLMLTKVYGDGNPDRGFSLILVPMRAVTLAWTQDDSERAMQIAKPILAKKMTAQKWPQWQSSWSVIDSINSLAKKQTPASFDNLKNGTYKGRCRGFVGLIRVSVNVSSGKVKSVKITKTKEDRPWSALDVIPARIVKNQSLNVDVVTGATVTSCAIIAATGDALKSARKK